MIPTSVPSLTHQERDRLALLRVTALTYPDRQKVEVWRDDVLLLVAAVDRLAAAPRVETLTVMHVTYPAPGTLLAGSMTVHQHRFPRRALRDRDSR